MASARDDATRSRLEASRERQRRPQAMMGIMGFCSEACVPGSVPFLHSIEGFPHYDGNVMIPFSNDFLALRVESGR